MHKMDESVYMVMKEENLKCRAKVCLICWSIKIAKLLYPLKFQILSYCFHNEAEKRRLQAKVCMLRFDKQKRWLLETYNIFLR